jgi:hypothetical protein
MTAESETAFARETYRHLRLLLITLPLLLLVGSILAAIVFNTVEGSISAYYLGPIRDIFVGAMIGTAVCLVAYRGDPLEDYALNVAGFYAVFVALVPTGLAKTLAELAADERVELLSSLRVSTGAVLIITAVFVYVERRTGHWTVPRLQARASTRWFFRLTTLFNVLFALFVIFRIVEGRSFGGVHLAATLLLMASLAIAVASHGWPEELGEGGGRYEKVYRTIALLMAAGVPLLGLLAWRLPDWEYRVILVEWYEIGLFAAFWLLETRRTWTPKPAASPTAAVPADQPAV